MKINSAFSWLFIVRYFIPGFLVAVFVEYFFSYESLLVAFVIAVIYTTCMYLLDMWLDKPTTVPKLVGLESRRMASEVAKSKEDWQELRLRQLIAQGTPLGNLTIEDHPNGSRTICVEGKPEYIWRPGPNPSDKDSTRLDNR